jgi:hypothetical protein
MTELENRQGNQDFKPTTHGGYRQGAGRKKICTVVKK